MSAREGVGVIIVYVFIKVAWIYITSASTAKKVAVLERAQSAEGISHGEKPHETLRGQI